MKIIKRLFWFLTSQFGFNPLLIFRALRSLPRYFRDLRHFRSKYKGRLEIVPCLNDWYEEGGTTRGEYFWQDLLMAKKIFRANPERHVDVGSRVDGFVAHVASFREIEVFDVRPITSIIPGILFRQVDFMKPNAEMTDYCDSLSCLHALEHFGLGRYGDPIDHEGFAKGLANMANMVNNNGVFYLSVPIGVERIEFNANRVFDPRVIVNLAVQSLLHLTNLTVVHQDSSVEVISIDGASLSELARQRYALGIFTFTKQCV